MHRIYFTEKLSQKAVAEKLGISVSTVSKIFRENNWTCRNNLKYATSEELKHVRTENRKKREQRIVELREALFGKQCRICGTERKLVIHKKDGEEHKLSLLRKLTFLQSTDPDEWAALCIPCHLGVHWMMSNYGKNWNQLETRAIELRSSPTKYRRPLELPNEKTPSSQRYVELKERFEGNRRELRMALFGENCYFCGVHYEDKRVAIHRKDGRPHEERLTVYEKYFRTLNPEEWVPLCQNHHRFTHWSMDSLDLGWDDLKRLRKKENGAEGEICSESE